MGEILEIINRIPLFTLVFLFGSACIITITILNRFLRRAFVNNYDPLRIQMILFIGPYLAGYLVFSFLTSIITPSFFIICIFLLVWLIVIRFIGRPQKVNLHDVMRPEFQSLILTVAGLVIVAHVIVNMIIPDKIPLLTEGGVYTRFEATQNSRVLSWLSFATGSIGGVMFALTENYRIRRFSVVVLILQTIAGLMFASKGAIVSIIFVLLFAVFIAQARGDNRRSHDIKRLLVRLSIFIAVLMPFYLGVIGFGSDDDYVLKLLAIRIIGGFDQLIPAAFLDLASNVEPRSLLGSNIIEYQFMPFMKSIFGMEFPYFSVGQYVIEAVTGTLIETAFTFPNSNLILETIFTSGFIFGFYIFFVQILLFYYFRYVAIKMPISPVGFFMVNGFVISPAGLFLSGQEWCTYAFVLGTIVFICWGISELFVAVRGVLKKNPLIALAPKR